MKSRSLLECDKNTSVWEAFVPAIMRRLRNLLESVCYGFAESGCTATKVKRLESAQYPRNVGCLANLDGEYPALIVCIAKCIFNLAAHMLGTH